MNYRKHITEPVGHTCPLIDEIISAVNSVSWDDTYWTARELIETLEKNKNSKFYTSGMGFRQSGRCYET